MRLLIIIPAYNEQDNLVKVVTKIQECCPQFDYIIINDGSTDNTMKICKKNNYNVVNLPINLGLAGAFQTGMKYALYNGYDCAIQYDGDGQHNPEYINIMLECMNSKKADIVIGSRFVEEKKPFTVRMLGGDIIKACIYITTGKRICDATSGMRLFNTTMVKKLAQIMNFGPEPDTVAYLIRCGAKVEEVQVEMNDRVAGESYFNLSTAVKYMFNMCCSILILQWFRKKGL